MKCIDEYYASSYHLSVEELNNINVHLASGLVKVDGFKKGERPSEVLVQRWFYNCDVPSSRLLRRRMD